MFPAELRLVANINKKQDFASIEGGWGGEGLEDLTGGVTTELFTSDILDKEHFWKEELMKVNEEFLFGCSSGMFNSRGYRRGVWEGHAYSIMKCVEIEGKRFCLVRNPWGEGEWNGPWSKSFSISSPVHTLTLSKVLQEEYWANDRCY